MTDRLAELREVLDNAECTCQDALAGDTNADCPVVVAMAALDQEWRDRQAIKRGYAFHDPADDNWPLPREGGVR